MTGIEYVGQMPAPRPKEVFFAGATAVLQGQGLCYDFDYGIAAVADGRRFRRVKVCSTANNLHFAGVASQSYAANPQGQNIVIFEPGSVCNILIGLNTVLKSTLLTASAQSIDGGWFTRAGLPGRGTALALQTVAGAATGVVPISSSLDGTAIVGAGDKVLTKTGLFTNAVVGDKVVIVSGSVTANGSAAATPGVYTIATRTSADAVVLNASPCAAASSVQVYVVRGNPVCQALLLDGPESGLQQHVAPITNAATSPVNMAGGLTHIGGGVTIAADTVVALADGGGGNVRKAFRLDGALTTGTAAITSSSMLKPTFATTASIKLAAARDCALLEWMPGAYWMALGGKGTLA